MTIFSPCSIKYEGRSQPKQILWGKINTHIYSLQNHQLNGKHSFGDNWLLNWRASYSKTGSDEPDRRQIMFIENNGKLELFKLNRQETMRYFGQLDEDEFAANISSTYKFGEMNKIQFGFNMKVLR